MHDYPEVFLNSLCGDLDFDWTCVPAKGRSRGILVGVNSNTLQVLDKESGTYCVTVKLCNKIDNFCWNIIVVYGDAQQSDKVAFWIELAQFINKSKLPMLVIGDFNLTRRESDKSKPGVFNKWSML